MLISIMLKGFGELSAETKDGAQGSLLPGRPYSHKVYTISEIGRSSSNAWDVSQVVEFRDGGGQQLASARNAEQEEHINTRLEC